MSFSSSFGHKREDFDGLPPTRWCQCAVQTFRYMLKPWVSIPGTIPCTNIDLIDTRPIPFALCVILSLFTPGSLPAHFWLQSLTGVEREFESWILEYTLFYKIVLGKSARHFLKIFVITFLKNI